MTTRRAGESAIGARSGEVDGLRGLAMLSVIALHAHLMPFGWIGVWLFYVISGYVVTLSVLEQHPEPQGLSQLGHFLRRRIARIVPIYYLFIGVGLASGLLRGLSQDPLSIAGLFGFFDNVLIIGGGGRVIGWPSGHLWTLSVEMQFYALYGVVLCLAPRRVTVALLGAVVIACPLGRLAVGEWLAAAGVPPLNAAFAVYAGPALHFDTFAMGCLLAFGATRGWLDRFARPLLVAGATGLALYASVFWAVNQFVRDEHGIAAARNIVSGILFGEYREVFLYSAVGLAMTGLVAVAARGDPLVRPILGWRPLQRIGVISYGGYLFHSPALFAAAMVVKPLQLGAAGNPVRLLICCAIAIPLAWLSYRYFEVPARRWLDGPWRAGVAIRPPRPGTSR